jgi:hypothetical protein
MKTKIFNLNTTICDSVRLVDPYGRQGIAEGALWAALGVVQTDCQSGILRTVES